MNTIAVTLTNISKKYEIHHEKPTLVEKFIKGPNETFWALRDINVEARKGERIGIIGPNGSGKTTLLKIITGITKPTSGTVSTSGNVISLIDLEAGFHEDLTGEQNIYLNGRILGLSKQTIDRQIDKIISFADIKQFIDAPLFTYSKGMVLRLGFAIIIHTNPSILLLDEYFAVGDRDFQEKARRWLKQYIKKGNTIFLVSQTPSLIRKYCNRIILLHEGHIKYDGKISNLPLWTNEYFQ